MLCGSHLTHSQSPILAALAHTLIRTSAGEWAIATWAISARMRPRTVSASPSGQTRLNERSRTDTGSAGTRAKLCMNRRSAPAHSGSRSSSGLVSGGTSRIASAWGPVAIRTFRKSGSAVVRCHIRLASTRDGRLAGSGP